MYNSNLGSMGLGVSNTGTSHYGTHLSPLQLHFILDSGVKLQYEWAQMLASPYSYPTTYEYAGPSVGRAGGFTFGGQSPDSALAQVALASCGPVGGIVQLENLHPLSGPTGYGALWWHAGPPETLPDFLLSSHPFEASPLAMGERPAWVGDRPGVPEKWRVSSCPSPISSCWSHVPSEFSAFGYVAARGAASVGVPPEMSL